MITTRRRSVNISVKSPNGHSICTHFREVQGPGAQQSPAVHTLGTKPKKRRKLYQKKKHDTTIVVSEMGNVPRCAVSERSKEEERRDEKRGKDTDRKQALGSKV